MKSIKQLGAAAELYPWTAGARIACGAVAGQVQYFWIRYELAEPYMAYGGPRRSIYRIRRRCCPRECYKMHHLSEARFVSQHLDMQMRYLKSVLLPAWRLLGLWMLRSGIPSALHMHICGYTEVPIVLHRSKELMVEDRLVRRRIMETSMPRK
jgi:hypothetical protein